MFKLLPQNVYVVDADREGRREVSFALGAALLQARPFGSAADFLDSLAELQPGVILLDVGRETGGFELMAELRNRKIEWPVIGMSGDGPVATAVRAMKLGAVDFIQKPADEETLVAALDEAFLLLKERIEKGARRMAAQARIELLSAREREVLRGLIAGLSNKGVSKCLGISLRTVEMHRANMMDHLGVGGLAEALTLAVHAGLEPLEQDAA